jgi:universal stress protein A
MNNSKILYATDFSPNSVTALGYASSLAVAEGATLIVAHVDDTTPGLVLGDVGYCYIPQVDEIAHKEFERLQKIVPIRDGVTFEHRFLRGDAADGILQLAELERADIIVIGTHGRTGQKLLLMGSVAEAVVRRAKCSVLTIKQPVEETKEPSLPEEIASQS